LKFNPLSARRRKCSRASFPVTGSKVAIFRSLLSSARQSLPSLGFRTDPLVRSGKDFGAIAEVKTLDEGKSDSAPVGFGPTAQPANKFLNHESTFTF
jgi:hypothetical protein